MFAEGLRALNASGSWASYTFDGLSSTTSIPSLDGGLDLTLFNGASLSPGAVGNAVAFDGVDDHASRTYQPSMSHPYLDFEARLKPGAWGYECFASLGGAYDLYLDWAGRVRLWANTGSGWMYKGSSSDAVPIGTWSKVAISYDGARWRFYVDDRPSGTVQDAGALVPGYAPLRVGAAGGGPYCFYQGLVDEVRFGPVPGPLVDLRMDEASGATLLDASPNGSHAVMTGSFQRIPQLIGDGRAVELDGATASGQVPSTAGLAPAQVRAEFYMRADNPSVAAYQYVVSQGRDYWGSGWSVALFAGRLYLLVNTDDEDDGCEVVVSLPYASTGWHHVRVSYDGATARLGVDEVEATAAGSGPIVYRNNEALTIGRLAFGSFYYFDGAIDQLRVHTVAW